MRIVAGVTTPTSGEIIVDGEPVEFTSVAQALQLGISLIHQELNLADNLTVGGQYLPGPRAAAVRPDRSDSDRPRIATSISTWSGSMSRRKRSSARSRSASSSSWRSPKRMSTNARMLIMDEPTSSLSEHESQKLFEVVCDLRARGVSILYISHRLHEVEQLADRVVVLRDGKFGRAVARREPAPEHGAADDRPRRVAVLSTHAPYARATKCSVNQLRTTTYPQHAVSFTLRAGEVVGLAGLVGAGRSELLTTLFGVTPAVGGCNDCRRAASTAANGARSDCRRHHARTRGSPPHRARVCR